MDGIQAKRSPLKYFVLVFALSTPIWIIETWVDINGLPLDIPATDIVAAFIPLISASILLHKEGEPDNVKKLLSRIFDFTRSGKKWYVPVIFLPALMFLLIYVTLYLMGQSLPAKVNIPVRSMPFLLVFFFLGAAGEEAGYMGYAIDPMQERWSALKASLIMGTLWAIWHYPSIIKQGHNLIWILWGTLGTIAMRILIVWLYNNTGKNLFICIFFHALYNLGRSLFPKDELHNPFVEYPGVHYSVIAIIAVITIFLWGEKTLTKFRYTSN